jgi:hypothetical protein
MAHVVVAGCLLVLLTAAPASAAPGWLSPSNLSEPGRDATNPVIAVADDGEMVALWERQSTLNFVTHVQLSTRPPGGSFTPPVDLALNSVEPRLVMNPDGTSVAVWRHFESPFNVIQASTRPPGGQFSPPVDVYTAPEKAIPQHIQLAVNEDGDVAVLWSEVDPSSGFGDIICEVDPKTESDIPCPNPTFVKASVRPAGGAFSTPVRISPPRGVAPPEEKPEEKEEREKSESRMTTFGGDIAIDGPGDAIAVWTYFDGEHRIAQASVRPAGGAFGVRETLSEAGENANEPDLDIDGAGNATVVWDRLEGITWFLRFADRPAGGSFGQPQSFGESSGRIEGPVLAVSPPGESLVAWRLGGKNKSTVEAALRSAGGSFSEPIEVSSGIDLAFFPDVALNSAGDAVVVWTGESSGGQSAKAAIRTGQTSFGKPTDLAQVKPTFFHPHPALDAAGNGATIWVRNDGASERVQFAGYDAVPPRLQRVSIPQEGVVGESIPFSASGFDVWPLGPPSFDFGDGGGATGSAVSHIYSAPGTYRVVASVTDSVGTVASTSGAISIVASNRFSLGRLRRNRRKGTATLFVHVPGPGELSLSGNGVIPAEARAAGSGEVALAVRSAGKAARRLRKGGKTRVRLGVSFAPDGGPPAAQELAVVLRKASARGSKRRARR